MATVIPFPIPLPPPNWAAIDAVLAEVQAEREAEEREIRERAHGSARPLRLVRP